MKYAIYIFTLLFALTFTSCEDFLDVNTDPNNPVEVTPDLILPVGQVFTAKYMQEDRGVNHLGNMMMFNWGESYGFSWYDDEFQYRVTTTFYDGLWDGLYEDAMKQYADLDDLAPEYSNYTAIGKIMKVFCFQILVDLYGDIPYSEALQRGEIPTPVYDDAETIYLDLLNELTEAVRLINSAEEGITEEVVPTGDVMFGGDMTQWAQFANTLKIRIITRYADVADAAVIAAQLDSIVANGAGFIAADVAIQPGFANEVDKQNYYWDELGWNAATPPVVTLSHDATCATQYVLDYLTSTNDPRISLIYEEPASGHLGVNQGDDNNDQALGPDYVSNIGPGHLKGPDMPAVIFTLAEHNFNMAELADKGLVTGDAQDYYEAGVLASLNYLSPETPSDNEAAAALYLSQAVPNVGWDASANKLEAIITQKWIATNGITAEQSWFDYSRTGYPSGLPISSQAPSTDRPVRLAYPNSEVTGNTLNIPDQPDVFTEKIFWAN